VKQQPQEKIKLKMERAYSIIRYMRQQFRYNKNKYDTSLEQHLLYNKNKFIMQIYLQAIKNNNIHDIEI